MRMFPMLVLYLSCAAPAAALQTWDALPALEVQHLQGAYAGRAVCPMCAHGYDAGLLVFLPTSTPAADARRVAHALQDTLAAVDDVRFRAFLVFTGATPSTALLDAVRGDAPTWYVAHMPDAALADASRQFALPLDGIAYGAVFAQRRLLWRFDIDDGALRALPLRAADALAFLRATYAQPVDAASPDTPRGRLWFAPTHLDAAIDTVHADKQLCLSDANARPVATALIGITPAGAARTRWARSDGSGCVALQTPSTPLRAEVFRALHAPFAQTIDPDAFAHAARVDLVIDPAPPRVTGHEPVALRCEGCELVFAGMPATLGTKAHITPPSEPGERLHLTGTMFARDGEPQPGMVVYAYQTDAGGRYPDAAPAGGATRHGRLRAWARSDAAGRYTFETIRPGAYPDRDEPQHIHLHVIEPGRCTYFVGDVLFTDDPRLDAAQRAGESLQPGGSGIVTPVGDARGGWTATRDIRLGLNLPPGACPP